MSVTFHISGIEVPKWIRDLFPSHELEMRDQDAAHEQWRKYEKAYAAWEEENGPVEVNLAIGNAVEVLRHLGKDTEELYGSLDPREVLLTLSISEPAALVRETRVEQSVIIDDEGVAAGPKIIHCGADEEYWTIRWNQLMDLAHKAIQANEKIYYG